MDLYDDNDGVEAKRSMEEGAWPMGQGGIRNVWKMWWSRLEITLVVLEWWSCGEGWLGQECLRPQYRKYRINVSRSTKLLPRPSIITPDGRHCNVVTDMASCGGYCTPIPGCSSHHHETIRTDHVVMKRLYVYTYAVLGLSLCYGPLFLLMWIFSSQSVQCLSTMCPFIKRYMEFIHDSCGRLLSNFLRSAF